ncbi:COG1361 S-layer family protein [Halopiger djelfimassiliensis]|uniref:COG1361 S-layer family protein n=1 Tax=Halopiger djelfimassiliensis TaxID=1293047 RepID=UPI0012B53812|nr:COG1361 S-layer family protein [Halopiger djelfimassiliensis]
MISSRRLSAGLVVLLLVVAGTGVPASVAALDRGEPNITVYLPENEVAAGSEATLELQLQNDAELLSGAGHEVRTARGVSVELEDAGPFEPKSGEQALGQIADGQITTATQRIEVPEDIDPGEYDVTVRVRYAYTNSHSERSGHSQRLTESETHDVTVVVPEEARFDITDVTSDVEPGADGPATLEITNVGSETARQARATISGIGGVTVDSGTAEEVLGDLEPRDSRNVTVDVDIAETVSQGHKPIEVAVTYQNSAGIERKAGPETARLSPAAEQTFSITGLEDTLSVGYDGEVTGELTNDGPRTVDDAVLIVEPMSDSLFVEDTRYALPELEPGETTSFSYPMDVSGQADPGPRQLRFTVEYTAGDRSTLEDGPITERVVVDPQEDEFSLEGVETTLRQGETNDLVIEITNERPETLSNVDVRIYTDDPLSATDDEAFVPELEPGESAEISFGVAAASSAPAKTHPVELDFQYETDRGETIVSDHYQFPVDVEAVEDEGGIGFVGLLVRGMAVLSIAGLCVGLWWRRR